MIMVKEVESVLITIKENVQETRQILKNWEMNLMFDRKEGRVYEFDDVNTSFNQLIQQRHSEIQESGKQIIKLLSNSNRILKVATYVVYLCCTSCAMNHSRGTRLFGHVVFD